MEKIDTSFFAKERAAELSVVGESVQRADARGHVTGRTQFYEDVTFPNTLHLKMVRSTRHHALIKKLDFEPALKVPGVVRVLTYKDVPNNWYTILKLIGVGPDDEPVLAEDRVRFMGEQICAVLADSPQAALEGARRVVVDYEDLPAVFDVEEAMTSTPFTAARHQLLRLRGPQLPAHPLRRRRQGVSRRPTTSSSIATNPRRSSMRRPSRPAARPSPKATAASPSTPTRRRSISRSTTWR